MALRNKKMEMESGQEEGIEGSRKNGKKSKNGGTQINNIKRIRN